MLYQSFCFVEYTKLHLRNCLIEVRMLERKVPILERKPFVEVIIGEEPVDPSMAYK